MSTNPDTIEFGLDSFGEVTTDGSGRLMTDPEAVRLMVDEAVLAERVGSRNNLTAIQKVPESKGIAFTENGITGPVIAGPV